MVQGRLIQQLAQPIVVMFIMISMLFSALPTGVGISHASKGQSDYYYLKEAAPADLRYSCSSVFQDIRKGKEGDVGVIVKSLKTINVNYLLDDYDNSLGSDRRKKVLSLEALLAEVAKSKRGIYCKVELAQYMKNHKFGNGPMYGDLLDDVFLELDEVYTSAKQDLARENFARARYAFDLIAPYKDSYRLYLQAAENFNGHLSEKNIATPASNDLTPAAENPEIAGEAGPIAMAVNAVQNSEAVNAVDTPGAIVLAAKQGPITAAANATK